MIIRKVSQRGHALGVSIPREVLAYMNVVNGDYVILAVVENGLLIRPLEVHTVAPEVPLRSEGDRARPDKGIE